MRKSLAEPSAPVLPTTESFAIIALKWFEMIDCLDVLGLKKITVRYLCAKGYPGAFHQ